MDIFLSIVAVIGVLLGLIIVLFRIEKFWKNRRRKTLLPQALQFGFTELPSKDFNIRTNYPSFLLLQRAHLNHDLILQRKLGRGLLQHVFDVDLRGGNQHEQITLCLVRFPDLQLPKFMIRGRDKIRFTMRIIHDVGRFTQSYLNHYHALPIKLSEDFQKQYELLAPNDSHGLERIFTSELIQLFEEYAGWQVEGMEDWILLYRRGIMVKPSQFSNFVSESQTLAEGFFRAGSRSS